MVRLVIVCILLFPNLTFAAVTLSEIAWMGSTASANHEWIELHNSGPSPVDVSGWTLTDNMNLTIPLAGSIAAGEYVVLERTTDDSAPGTAFLIYTGALVNTGATLSLRRADGGLEDQVAGGENWQLLGGDNVTKETAQYTTSGWVTGPATPGRANVTSGSVTTTESASTATESTSNTAPRSSGSARPSASGTAAPTLLTLPPVTLDLAITGQSIAYVNQAVELSVEPSGIGATLANSLTYDWNFGDSHTEKGKTVTHRFTHPGTYLITVHGHYKRQTKVGRFEITILPVRLSVTRTSTGDLQLHNDAPYEKDISGFSLIGTKTLTFAPHTIILPNQTVTVAGERIGSTVTVTDATGAVVVREGETRPEVITTEPLLGGTTITAPPIESLRETVEENTTVTEDETVYEVPPLITIPAAEAAAGAAPASAAPNPRWPYAALALLLGAVSLGLLLRPAHAYTE